MVTQAAQLDINDCIARINELRQKQIGGEDLSDEELKEGIALLASVRQMRSGGKTVNAAGGGADKNAKMTDLGF